MIGSSAKSSKLRIDLSTAVRLLSLMRTTTRRLDRDFHLSIRPAALETAIARPVVRDHSQDVVAWLAKGGRGLRLPGECCGGRPFEIGLLDSRACVCERDGTWPPELAPRKGDGGRSGTQAGQGRGGIISNPQGQVYWFRQRDGECFRLAGGTVHPGTAL